MYKTACRNYNRPKRDSRSWKEVCDERVFKTGIEAEEYNFYTNGYYGSLNFKVIRCSSCSKIHLVRK